MVTLGLIVISPPILVRWLIHVSTTAHASMFHRLCIRAHAFRGLLVYSVRAIFDLVNRGLALVMASVMKLVPLHFSVNAILAMKVLIVNRLPITVVVSYVKTMGNAVRFY